MEKLYYEILSMFDTDLFRNKYETLSFEKKTKLLIQLLQNRRPSYLKDPDTLESIDTMISIIQQGDYITPEQCDISYLKSQLKMLHTLFVMNQV